MTTMDDLGGRWFAHAKVWDWLVMGLATGILLSMIPSTDPVRAEMSMSTVDVEVRGGTDYLCGTCGPYRFRPLTQVFVDVLVPIFPLKVGTVEGGLYGKGALLDGHVPQIAGGVLLGYRVGRYEILGHLGRAYATERIGETMIHSSGQTKGTYDLGMFARYAITERLFLSAGYQHNSNGEGVGLKFISGKGTNHGIDSVVVGGGIRF